MLTGTVQRGVVIVRHRLAVCHGFDKLFSGPIRDPQYCGFHAAGVVGCCEVSHR
jgi:hypothetical protein